MSPERNLKQHVQANYFQELPNQFNQTNFIPTVGVYSSVEFSQSGNNAVSQWSVSLQGGISF